MPRYTFVYKNEEGTTLKSEVVVMKSLTGAKTSASGNAPGLATLIEIKDPLDLVIAIKRGNKWRDTTTARRKIEEYQEDLALKAKLEW